MSSPRELWTLDISTVFILAILETVAPHLNQRLLRVLVGRRVFTASMHFSISSRLTLITQARVRPAIR